MNRGTDGSKKVFILNFTGADYGSQLQYYALLKTIKDLGHEPVCIAWKLNYLRTNIRSINRFRIFSNSYLNLDNSCFSKKELSKQISDGSVVIICGKNNFNNWGWFKSDGLPFLRYFADFVSGKKVLAAYAAHFDIAKIKDNNYIKSECKKLLQRFDKLSVDNKSDADILNKEFQVKSDLILDPVFLLSSDNYEHLLETKTKPNADKDRRYIAYMVVNDIWGLGIPQITLPGEFIFNIYTAKGGFDFNSIGTWLFYIKSSKLVVSDYFHCIAFALIYKKPFVALIDKDTTNNPLNDLLLSLNLKSRIKHSLEEINENDLNELIEWESVEQIISHRILESRKFLSEAINVNPGLKSTYSNRQLSQIRRKKEEEYLHQIYPIYERSIQTKNLDTKRRLLRILIKILVSRKKYKKLKRDYNLFFRDSKSRVIKFIGKYYKSDNFTVDILRKPQLSDFSSNNVDTISLYYHASGFNNKYNVGDLLSKYVVERLSNKKVIWTSNKDPNKLCAIGTMLGDYLLVSGGHFWGCGYGGVSINEKSIAINRKVNFYAVRGPISRDFVLSRGVACPDVYGDPALLLPDLYACSKPKKYKIGLICHYTHGHIFNYDDGVSLIDIMRSPENMLSIVDEICQCEIILSSSLHGIIIANAYGIPARWFILNGFPLQAYPKYHDYFLSVRMPIQIPLVLEENTIISPKLDLKADKTVDLKIDLGLLKNSFPYNL